MLKRFRFLSLQPMQSTFAALTGQWRYVVSETSLLSILSRAMDEQVLGSSLSTIKLTT